MFHFDGRLSWPNVLTELTLPENKCIILISFETWSLVLYLSLIAFCDSRITSSSFEPEMNQVLL